MTLATLLSRTPQGLEAPLVRVEVDVGGRPAGVFGRRAARDRGQGEQGPRARGARQLRLRVSRGPRHGQPRAGRPAEGRRPVRPGHRRRHPRRVGPAAGGTLRRRRAVRRAVAGRRPARHARLAAECAAGRAASGTADRADGQRRARRRWRAVRACSSRRTCGRCAGTRRGSRRWRSKRRSIATARSAARVTVPDLADVRGQAGARRALEIAAAGEHSLLLIGPPGSGKSMLAQRLPGLLPELDEDEAIESAAIRSLSLHGFRLDDWRRRPFRAPHHTASAVALVGGGGRPRPGEISLAHNGVLFLDELPEFDRHVLEVLREPLESGHIVLSRAARQAEYPGALPAGGRDESLSVRSLRRSARTLPLPARAHRRLSQPHLRAAARPHRPARRGRAASRSRRSRRRASPEGSAVVATSALPRRAQLQRSRQARTNARLAADDLARACRAGRARRSSCWHARCGSSACRHVPTIACCASRARLPTSPAALP